MAFDVFLRIFDASSDFLFFEKLFTFTTLFLFLFLS